MRASVIREIIFELDGIDGDEDTKRKAKDVVRRIANEEGVTAAERLDRVGFAIALLDAKEARTIIRDRIVVRYTVSVRTAQRVIDTALQLRQKPQIFVAQTGNTSFSEIGN